MSQEFIDALYSNPPNKLHEKVLSPPFYRGENQGSGTKPGLRRRSKTRSVFMYLILASGHLRVLAMEELGVSSHRAGAGLGLCSGLADSRGGVSTLCLLPVLLASTGTLRAAGTALRGGDSNRRTSL